MECFEPGVVGETTLDGVIYELRKRKPRLVVEMPKD